MANNPLVGMTINDIATVVNAIQLQATGRASTQAITNTSDFVAVGQNLLKTGVDPVMNAISQVLSKTIFSTRPYGAKFEGLRVDAMKYGNHVRKLESIDKDFEANPEYTLTDGASVDMFKVNKPKVVQTNFYGQTTYQKSMTIFKDQLDVAFSSPDEFASFIGMIMQNANDQIQQAHENTARMTVANLIGMCITNGNTQYVKLVTKYNDYTGGGTETWATIKADPDKYQSFVKWMCGYVKTLVGYMGERSALYHSKIYDGSAAVDIMKHTPLNHMKAYMLTDPLNQIESNVFASIFNPEYLYMVDHESVSFWQGLQEPMCVNVNCNYYDSADGTIKQADVHNDLVLGVLFDDEAAGYTVVNEWSGSTVFNPAGMYSNVYWKFTDRYYNCATENAICLTLE